MKRDFIPGMIKKWPFLFDVIFFAIIAMLVIASFFSFRQISNLNQSANEVIQTSELRFLIEKAVFKVTEAESAQRGFLLTHDSSFLKIVKVAQKEALETVAKVGYTVEGNPAQKKLWKQFSDYISLRLGRIDLVLSRPYYPVTVKDPILSKGKIIMDSLVKVSESMILRENENLKKRSESKSHFEFVTPFSALLFSIIAICLIAFTYYRLRKEGIAKVEAQSTASVMEDYFQQIPAFVNVLEGPEHRFAYLNQAAKYLIGNRDLIGATYRESFPELVDQGILDRLDEVYNTGEPFHARELEIDYERDGITEKRFFNILFQYYHSSVNDKKGVLIFGYAVDEMIEARKKIEILEERSRIALESAQMGIFDWDVAEGKVSASLRTRAIMGWGPDADPTHEQMIATYLPADKPIRDEAIKNALHSGKLEYEARIRRSGDGEIRWIRTVGKVFYGEDGKPLRLSGTVADITESKNLWEELRQNEIRFRLLANSIPDQVWTTDAEGNLNYVNAAVSRYSGISDEALHSGWSDFVHPDDREKSMREWNESLKTGKEFMIEHRLKNKQGDYRWHLTKAVPQKNELDETIMWVGTSSDIHDQKEERSSLEEKVKERTLKISEQGQQIQRNEDRYYNMLNELQDYAVILLDTSGTIQNWNTGAEKIKGYKAEEVIGKNFTIFYTPEDRERGLPLQLIKEAAQKGRAVSEGWRMRKNGERFWSSVVFTALHDDENNVTGFLKITRNLTEKKKAEDQQLEYLKSIEQKNLELQRTNAELESFNYIASHDLQEPLRKIQAFSQLIVEKEKDHLSSTGKDYFSRMNSAASRMQNLLESLIRYSQTSNQPQYLTRVSLNNVLEQVKEDLSEAISDTGATVETDDLPEINGDEVQLLQLFSNLISNAMKYRKAGIAPHITIKASSLSEADVGVPDEKVSPNYWHITVTDNGIGFEQKYAYKIFELFQRLHGASSYKGTGIGLAICKKIMRNHHGFITAIGNPDKGAVFNLFFPISA